MLQIRNNATLTSPVSFSSSAAIIPFDTTVINTNANLALSNNMILEKNSGFYNSVLFVDLQNSGASSVDVAVQAYADGVPIEGAIADVIIPAASKTSVTLPWATEIVSASGSTANISWYITGAVDLLNAIAIITKIV